MKSGTARDNAQSRVRLRSDALRRYRAKRDFSRTAEPNDSGAIRPAEHRRFVIQRHAAHRLHYDLRLELDGVFKSWALTRRPSLDPSVKRLAVQVEDHPLDYGDFEGTIPQGQYGGGTVQIWDRGYWAPEGDESPERALEHGELKFILMGERLQGRFVLVRMRNSREGRENRERENWLLIKHTKEQASARPAKALPEDRSVASGRTIAEITAGKGPAPRAFMLRNSASASTPARRLEKRASGAKDPPVPGGGAHPAARPRTRPLRKRAARERLSGG